MSRRIVQILGTNGAGKTTALRRLVGDDAKLVDGVTLLPQLNVALVGNYTATAPKTTGCDAIRGGKAGILATLDRALALCTGTIAWEGIIIMTRQYHAQLLARDLCPVYVSLGTPLDDCFARIEARSGKTRAQLKQNGGIVVNRHRSVQRLAAYFYSQGAPVYEGADYGLVEDLIKGMVVRPRRTPV